MYLFIFFWSAELKAARATTQFDSSPPFGLVFATFMTSMMLGSQLFTICGSRLTVPRAVQYLSVNMLVAATALLTVVSSIREDVTLWAFCIFELCVGFYFPSMGYLKGQMVPDGVRGKVYGLLRLPLNTFVVVTLGFTQEGELLVS